MPRFGSILDRFRRLVAPPGRPAEAIGVPDSGAEVEAELAPVLGDLAGIDAEATRIEREAAARAADIRDGARRQAATIIAQARDQAPAERARAREAAAGRRAGGRRGGPRRQPP